MFIGEYQHALDTKGRLIIPSKFRDELGEEFIITKGLDNCLFVYPMDAWKVLEKKLNKLPLTNREARAFVRFFFSGASESKLDKQGRVLIPMNLRNHAKAEKDMVVIGVASRLELWSLDVWNEYNSDENISYEDIADKMYELGI